MKYKIYIVPYQPSSNGCIEGFHNFLKACISKHVSSQLYWTSVIPLACAAYNFLPNEHSKESPFFLMFGRDAVLPLNSLFSPQMHYLGNDLNGLSLEALKNMFHIATENLHHARMCKLLLPQIMQDAFRRFSCSEVCAGLGNGCERFCASRSLLGSYVHQEPI